jgi:hypothetical protein
MAKKLTKSDRFPEDDRFGGKRKDVNLDIALLTLQSHEINPDHLGTPDEIKRVYAVLLLVETLVGLVVTKATNEEILVYVARALRALHWAVRSREAPRPDATALTLQAGQLLQHRYTPAVTGKRQALEEAQAQAESDVAVQIAATADFLQVELLQRQVDWQAVHMVALLEVIIAVVSIRAGSNLDDETDDWRRDQTRQILGPFCQVVFPRHPESPEVFTDRQVGMLSGTMANTRESHRGRKLSAEIKQGHPGRKSRIESIENSLRVAEECLALPEANAG